MTPQEIFDTVVSHLRIQGRPAIHTDGPTVGRCAYRSSNGTKCAVGCLIPDSIYTPLMEGDAVPSIYRYLSEEMFLWFNFNSGLLRNLQKAHDLWSDHQSREYLEDSLQTVANRFNLVYTKEQK